MQKIGRTLRTTRIENDKRHPAHYKNRKELQDNSMLTNRKKSTMNQRKIAHEKLQL